MSAVVLVDPIEYQRHPGEPNPPALRAGLRAQRRFPRRRGRRYVRAVKVTIRPYDQRDADDLAEVFFRSVRQAALSDYTVAQVKAWLRERPTSALMHHRANDGACSLWLVRQPGAYSSGEALRS